MFYIIPNKIEYYINYRTYIKILLHIVHMITDMDIDMNTEILSSPAMNTKQEDHTYKNILLRNIMSKNGIPENTYIIRGDEYLQTVELGRKFNTDVRVYSPQDYKLDIPIYLSKTTYTVGLGELSTTMDILDFRKLFHECCFRAGFHIEANYMNDLVKQSAQKEKSFKQMRRTSEAYDYLDLSSDSADIHHHDKLVFNMAGDLMQYSILVTYYIGAWKNNLYSTNKTYVIEFRPINNSSCHTDIIIGKIQKQLTLKNYKHFDWKLVPYFNIKKSGMHCSLKRKELNAIAELLNNSVKV